MERSEPPPERHHVEVLEVPPGQGSSTVFDPLETELLDQADALIEKGAIIEALQFVAQAISCCEGHFSHRVFKSIETALAHPNYRMDSRGSAATCLIDLKAAFPKTGYGPVTGCWVAAVSEIMGKETEVQRLRDTIRSQERKIKTLEEQIAQLIAVDLEPVQSESAVEVP
ncbi:MAG: hypothetical protein WBB19_13270 [Desulforhopalus sp.]